MRLFLLADQPVVRAGLKLVLRTDPDIAIVGEASSADQAARALLSARAEVAVVDLLEAGMADAATAELRHRAPLVRVLVLAEHARLGDMLAALAAGARGFALGTEPVEALRAALHAVARGQEYITPVFASLMARRHGTRPAKVFDMLSLREREVLDLVAHGSTIAVAAQMLGISRKTVETHLHRLHRKLGCNNLGDLVRFAASHGLLPAPASDHPSDTLMLAPVNTNDEHALVAAHGP